MMEQVERRNREGPWNAGSEVGAFGSVPCPSYCIR